MCGRYAYKQLQEMPELELHERLSALGTNLNVSPSQQVAIIEPGMVLAPALWGMTSTFRPDLTINARCETVHELTMFRHAFRTRRCLVPAVGWYEWPAPKQPHFLRLKDGGDLAFAGILQPALPMQRMAILTTAAARSITQIHDRMPVIIPRNSWARWLDQGTSVIELAAMFEPWSGELEAYPVRAAGSIDRIQIEPERGLFG